MTNRFHVFRRVIYLLAILALISCAPPPVLPASKSTEEICAPATLIPTPPTKTPVPPPILTHYFILIDRSGSYYATVDSVINLIEETLQSILRPGDKITIAWISSVSGQATENIFDGYFPMTLKVEKEGPMVLAPHPNHPDLLELPPSTPGTTMHQMQETATAEEIIRENQKRVNDYNCNVRKWNQGVEEKIVPQVTSTPNQQGQPFMENLIRTLENAKLVSLSGATDIYGALWDVTQSFSVGRGTDQFQQFKLIIFSDMVDTQNLRNLPLNLDEVDVIVAWFECGEPKDCNRRQQYWSEKFLGANANSVNYLRERESTTQNLVSLLSR